MEIAYDPSEPTNNKPSGTNRRVLATPFGVPQHQATRLDEPSPVEVSGYANNQGRMPLKSPFGRAPDAEEDHEDVELEGNISLGNGGGNYCQPSQPRNNSVNNRGQDQFSVRVDNEFESGSENAPLIKGGNSLMSSVLGFATMFGGNPQGNNGQPAYEYDEENEPPLLEDLGIDLKLIKMRALSVIKFRKCPEEFVKEADMSGPLLLVLLFGVLLLLRGKIHFGYIYGFGVIGTLAVYLLMNLLSQHTKVKLYNTMSILGYCIFPVVVLAFVAVFLPLSNAFGFILAVLAIGWATLAATNFFEVLLDLKEQKWLIAYPIFLFYMVFVIITIF